MELKRYSLNELETKCREIFYEHMINGDSLYQHGQIISCTPNNPTPIHLIHQYYINAVQTFEFRICEYRERIKVLKDKELTKVLKEQIEYLSNELSILKDTDLNKQKEIYEKSYDLRLSRTSVHIPLNKLINSFYDDISLEILFYDNVCTPKGLFEKYLNLKNDEDRIRFLKVNISITHIALTFSRPGTNEVFCIIPIFGKTSESKTVKNVSVLPAKFGDFQHLTLSDLNNIRNNDLKQILQSKIDMDKEPLACLANLNIRGDNYKLFYKQGSTSLDREFYIRYVCSSTGRVYYNKLDLNNLALSDYYRSNNYDSYLKAWWNITHLGARVDGNPVISC